MTIVPLVQLAAGSLIPLAGGRAFRVSDALAAAYRPGDELIVLRDEGRVLHVPRAQHAVATAAVTAATAAFEALAAIDDDAITRFFVLFAERLADAATFARIADANACDVARARAAGRSVARLALTDRMRADMIAGLRAWGAAGSVRARVVEAVHHDGWAVELATAPLGVVGFVFEGRPNVFADAAGVLRTGNSVVFRIGRDALDTARATMREAVWPALDGAELPRGAMTLLDDPSHEVAWALFADRRLALAVARGSGEAVALLGAVARGSGIAVSLHGAGGAWLYVDEAAELDRTRAAFAHSLDRKVCNTLNVCLLHRARVDDVLPALLAELAAIARAGGAPVSVRAVAPLGGVLADALAAAVADDLVRISALPAEELGREWEWEDAPEISLAAVADLDEAVALFNRWSPRFVASILSADQEARRRFGAAVEAPFVCDGMTRWVDGQYALGKPELGLSNWQNGRLLGRGAILSGDGIHTVRTFATQHVSTLRR